MIEQSHRRALNLSTKTVVRETAELMRTGPRGFHRGPKRSRFNREAGYITADFPSSVQPACRSGADHTFGRDNREAA